MNTQSGDDDNDNDKEESFDYQLKHAETEANSAIILKAGPKEGARHSVSSLKSGRRAILKFVFVREDAVFGGGRGACKSIHVEEGKGQEEEKKKQEVKLSFK